MNMTYFRGAAKAHRHADGHAQPPGRLLPPAYLLGGVEEELALPEPAAVYALEEEAPVPGGVPEAEVERALVRPRVPRPLHLGPPGRPDVYVWQAADVPLERHALLELLAVDLPGGWGQGGGGDEKMPEKVAFETQIKSAGVVYN